MRTKVLFYENIILISCLWQVGGLTRDDEVWREDAQHTTVQTVTTAAYRTGVFYVHWVHDKSQNPSVEIQSNSPHLLSNVVPVHVTLASIHLLPVEETASVGHQQGLAHILVICSRIEEKVRFPAIGATAAYG